MSKVLLSILADKSPTLLSWGAAAAAARLTSDAMRHHAGNLLPKVSAVFVMRRGACGKHQRESRAKRFDEAVQAAVAKMLAAGQKISRRAVFAVLRAEGLQFNGRSRAKDFARIVNSLGISEIVKVQNRDGGRAPTKRLPID